MTGSDVFGMPVDTAGLDTGIADGTSLPITIASVAYPEPFNLNNHNKIISGFPMHQMVQGETINHFQDSLRTPNYAKVSSSDGVGDLQLGRDIIGDFTSSTSYPVNGTVQDQLTEGMPFPAASLATLLACKYGHHENLESFATVISSDYSDTVNHSIEESLHCGYGAVAIDSSTGWDFNKIVDPLELSGTVTGRRALQPFQLLENITANGCISSENAQMSSYSPSGSSRYSNELSLSLATSQPSVICRTSIHDRCSDISCSGISNHSLYDPPLGQDQTSCNLRDVSSCSNSYKPGHLPQHLSRSRYLHVMQEILADFARFSNDNIDLTGYPAMGIFNDANASSHSTDAAAGCSSTLGFVDSSSRGKSSLNQMEPTLHCSDLERRRNKHLLTLLQEVDNQYSQWLDEIHTVISAFHAVTELDPQIHTRFALQTISLLYKDLRERISSHILAMGVCFSKVGPTEEEKSFEMSFIQKQWALQQLKRKDQQLWRPQRGLPERSVSVLRAWMFQNFLHPYPKDAEKHLLAVKSGLTRSQVSNWFINARVRLWKPLIEEMYAEMNRRKNQRNEAENRSAFRNREAIETRRFSLN